MQEWWINLSCTIRCRDEDERDEIIERLKRALAETEFKVADIELFSAERSE